MITKSENVVFKVLRQNSNTTIVDENNRPRRHSLNLGIAAEIDIIEDNAPRTIRYVSGQRTIFKDEQKGEEAQLRRRISKPNFEDGILVVPASQGVLIDFLRKHPWNEANSHYAIPNQKFYFYEHKPQEIASKLNKEAQERSNSVQLVYSSDFTSKILPIARWLGFDISRESKTIIWDMKNYAEANPQKFIELLDDARVSRFDEVQRAIDMNTISVTSNSIKWSDGRSIAEVPKTKDSLKYLVDISFRPEYTSTWAEIVSLMNEEGSGTHDEQILEEVQSSKIEALKTASDEELFEAGKEDKVIEWKAPYYIFFNHKAKGKDKFLSLMEDNKKIRTLLITALGVD